MLPPKSRPGVWVPRACAIPLVVICLIVFVADRCSRHA